MSPKLILTNGKVYTIDATRPTATAIAMQDGKILAVGNDGTILALQSSGTTHIDLNGRCVIPGLIDAHVHFRNYALSLRQVDLIGVPSVDEALARVGAQVARTPRGEWVQGRGWAQADWPDFAFPTAAQLDGVAPNHPVYLRHKSGHAGWANSIAMRMAGISATTPDPAGGAIQHDADGEPTGILLEAPAMRLVSQHIPPPTEAQLVAAMREAQQKCWEVGLVGLHDYDGRDCFQALQAMRNNGELGLRIVKNINAPRIEYAIGVGLRSGFGDEWLRIGGIKIFADGALGPRTALMLDPYENEPDNLGIAVVEKEEMMQIAHDAMAHQLSLTIHAIGDKAVHDVLDVYEAAQASAKNPARLRNRIEHVQLLHPADLPRLAQLDVIASMQPTHATSDMHMVDRYWGERGVGAYAFRPILDSGATLVFGSDCPIEAIDPLPGIHAAVTRRRADGSPNTDGWYPQHKMTMHETIHAFTMASAITSGQEATAGSISVGKSADLTIFERDIFEIPHDELLETPIAGTVVGGEFKHRTW